jgi:hypothetical protein
MPGVKAQLSRSPTQRAVACSASGGQHATPSALPHEKQRCVAGSQPPESHISFLFQKFGE